MNSYCIRMHAHAVNDHLFHVDGANVSLPLVLPLD